MMNQAIVNRLISSIKELSEGGELNASKLFKVWFNSKGKGFYFLFKKNLKVTNIQFGELLSLLRAYSSIYESDGNNCQAQKLHFLSSSEFINRVDKLIDSLPKDAFNKQDFIEKFCSLYLPLFSNIIIVDVFFGSCSIFVPYHIDVDVRAICAYSGYIHSAGRCVYIRNITKSSKDSFYEAIDRHLKNYCSDNKTVFFAVYAHEDFTRYDRAWIDSLKNGLDDVKIFVEKFYMGDISLVSILKEMTERYKNRLEIPEPGDYRIIRNKNKSKLENSKTIWLIIDHSINKDFIKIPGNTSYFICYEQLYINENPYHIFDENKPAWISHTTVPHTLMGAMINLTRPYWKHDQKITLKDPFSGCGTTFLEGLKYSNLEVHASDIESITPLLIKDNFDFFSYTQDELKDIKKQLNNLIESLSSPRHDTSPLGTAYYWAIDMLEKSGLNRDFYMAQEIDSIINEIQSKDFFDRLLFYIALRTNKRHIAAFERQSETWKDAFIKECRIIENQIDDLIKQKSKVLVETDDRIAIYQGSYSLSCSIDFNTVQMSKEYLTVGDAREISPNSYDLIITDPPYGFNTNTESFDLASLFQEMIRCFINALKTEGQLVLCLPDQSKTGKKLPYFNQKELIIQQVIMISEELNFEIVNPTFFAPEKFSLFRPPFYWESERALRRSILHFRIRKFNALNKSDS